MFILKIELFIYDYYLAYFWGGETGKSFGEFLMAIMAGS